MKINILTTALVLGLALTITGRAADVTPAEARAIAKDAYIFAYPLVMNYRVLVTTRSSPGLVLRDQTLKN